MKKTEALQNFLGSTYNPCMECQVNVAQDGGDRIEGDFKGKKWHGWTDGIKVWKSFRIPYNANTEPTFNDSDMTFDLKEHAEGIGMTGWDWKNKVSKWVAFDFDAIIGHSEKHVKKLTPEELNQIVEITKNIPWVTVKTSTSGRGLHIYVYLDDIPTQNHTEHAALARAILGKMSALVAYDFKSKVDTCGGNMWVWHRKQTPQGFQIIKQGEVLEDVPNNWRDHLVVVRGARRKNLPQYIEADKIVTFEELAGQYPRVPLDANHKKLLDYFTNNEYYWEWNADHYLLVTHTKLLEKAFNDLGLKGIFKSDSPGTDLLHPNCFCIPMRKGVWVVRRFSPGIQEHESWVQDGTGWTKCYFNRDIDLPTACKAYGGIEDPKGGFVFRELESAVQAIQQLGLSFKYDFSLNSRRAVIRSTKHNKLILEVEHHGEDRGDTMTGWLIQKDKWTRVFNIYLNTQIDTDYFNYDDLFRHLVTESGTNYGWSIKSDNQWRDEPLTHVKISLSSLGLSLKEVTNIMGASIFKCWKLVNRPFQPEYPGDREWNRNSAQFKYTPSLNIDSLHFETWLQVLKHCGKELDPHIQNNIWCKNNGILTGSDYLKCWIASIFQYPLEPLPYLFFWGEQNCGKSIFHEAISLLITEGYKKANAAVVSDAGFNAELKGMLICVLEEINLKKNIAAYNRIKDWVTTREMLIHPKKETPYHIPNTTHWIQCGNNHQDCPIFPGDTRITMIHVPVLEKIIPKKRLIEQLEKEAPDFLAEILHLELPESNDRLNIPVITTDDKAIVQQSNQSLLDQFIIERCLKISGQIIKFSEFYDQFIIWLQTISMEDSVKWSKVRVGRELPPQIVKGRNHTDGQYYLGNIWWTNKEYKENNKRCIFSNDYLELVESK